VPGQRIRLAGQGSRGADVLITLRVTSADPRYSVSERDVHVDVPVAPWEAALGASVPVDTPEGRVELKIPAGSHSGRRLRFTGRGLGGRDGRARGDLFAVVRIVNPPAGSAAAQALFRRMAEELDFDPRAGSG
jgi:curved DNA-binding protein